jgi:DtxR family Mn-dependent transcriptional regulator
MPATHGIEEYLEAIYVLTVEGEPCTGARLADYLGVSPVSVSRALTRLARAGHLARRQPRVELTAAGWAEAESVVRRHRLAERWLADTLGLDWVEAHREAGRLEHALSPAVERRLWEELGRPRTCPHGNPIPGLAGDLPEAIRLSHVQPGAYVVDRIFEQLEGLEERLRFLAAEGLVPGAVVEVRGRDPSGASVVQVRGRVRPVTLPPAVADKILVAPVPGGSAVDDVLERSREPSPPTQAQEQQGPEELPHRDRPLEEGHRRRARGSGQEGGEPGVE